MGYVEAVQVFYDQAKVTYEQILDVLWRHIDPTDAGGQFADRGPYYRSAIFYHNDVQKKLAEASREALGKSGRFHKPIVTEILPFVKFYNAEEYHLDYYKKIPLRYRYYRYGSGRDQFLEEVWGKGAGALRPGRQDRPAGRGLHQAGQRELEEALDAAAVRGDPAGGYGTALPERLLGQQAGGDLRGHRFRRAPLQFLGQVRFRHRVAQLYQTPGGGQHRGEGGQQRLYDARRGPEPACRLPSGARLSDGPLPTA
jgi:hypothetical protein